MRQNKIHRIFIDADINIGSKITPDKNTAARIKRILRIKRNEKIIIFNGDGQDYICIFDDSDREKILVERSEKNSKINYNNTLALSISNNKSMDFAIQKSVELGVNKILPVITERSHPTDIAKRYLHWNQIIISACEQCGVSLIPSLGNSIELSELAKCSASLDEERICFDPNGENYDPHTANSKKYTLLIGPEGGFSSDEISILTKYGWSIISLGDRILRTETACIVAQTLMRTW